MHAAASRPCNIGSLFHFWLASQWTACYGATTFRAVNATASPDDYALLRSAADGDKKAFQQIYERHSSTLFGLALKILGDRTDAEDVLQEAFVQVWKSAGIFDPKRSQPLGWLIMLTRSRAIDRLRSRQT